MILAARFALVAALALAAGPAGVAAKKASARKAAGPGQACLDCHAQISPQIVGDWKLSRHYGITGVPTFVVGRHGVVGAQPYEALEELV